MRQPSLMNCSRPAATRTDKQATLAQMARAKITPRQRLVRKREWLTSLDFGGIGVGNEKILRELGDASLRTFEAEVGVDRIGQNLRRSRHPWSQIATVLGVTRRAAPEKFGG